MKIKYYLNFYEEKRHSMNDYAQRLIDYQTEKFKNHEIDFYRPKLNLVSKIIFFENWKMRYARYISYQNQVKKLPKHDIAHICDHQYAHLLPYINSRLKFITVHDVIPLIFEKKLKKNPLLVKFSLSQLKYFTRVFAVSNSTKRDLIKYTDCPQNKIDVIGESIEDFFNINPIDKNNICQKYNIPIDKKKILISGNIFYKNNDTAFKVLENLINYNKNIIFIHIGSGDFKTNVPKFFHNNIIRIPFIGRKELPNIYKISDILFFPSIYEGFGLPLLEAMSCGLPIVCSDNSSLPEVTGDAAIMSNCYDTSQFTKNILKVLNDKKLYISLIKKSCERSKFFNSFKINKRIISLYEEEMKKYLNNNTRL
tara:strand:+ start:2156 stop:3256 length:1101 start_codon:yes stop_codon:yes gene_type:complete